MKKDGAEYARELWGNIGTYENYTINRCKRMDNENTKNGHVRGRTEKSVQNNENKFL